MKNFKPYSKNTITFIDGQGKKITVEVSEEVAREWNRDDWRWDYQERKRRAPVKRKDVEGNLMDFDPTANSREWSWEQLISLGGERQCDFGESLEDMVLNKVSTETRIGILNSILHTLSDDEHHIIDAVMEGLSSREYEKKYGTPRKTYLYRKEKLFSRLRSMVEAQERGKDLSATRL